MSRTNLRVLSFCIAISFGLFKASKVYDQNCTTNAGKSSLCDPLRNCQEIIKGEQFRAADKNYLQNFECYKNILIQPNCGQFGSQSLLDRGKEVVIKTRPWMVLLKFKKTKGKSHFFCDGTLISNRYVLTAAFCVYEKTPRHMFVQLGDHQISTKTDCRKDRLMRYVCAPAAKAIGVEKILVHEKYSNVTGYNDIALLKLEQDVEYSETISPICLPVNKTLQQHGDLLTSYRVTGWGKTKNLSKSDVPLETFIMRRNQAECQAHYEHKMLTSQLCAGKGGENACEGDSGSSLMYLGTYLDTERFVQYGIVSYKFRNCLDGNYAIHTNVASFINWITDKVMSN